MKSKHKLEQKIVFCFDQNNLGLSSSKTQSARQDTYIRIMLFFFIIFLLKKSHYFFHSHSLLCSSFFNNSIIFFYAKSSFFSQNNKLVVSKGKVMANGIMFHSSDCQSFKIWPCSATFSCHVSFCWVKSAFAE